MNFRNLGRKQPSGTALAVPFHRPGRPQATAPQLPLGAVADSSRIDGLLHALAPVDVRWDWPAKGGR